jgi:hypothetical protein
MMRSSSVSLLKFSTTAAILSFFSSAAVASGLTYATASVGVYCCTAPIISNRISNAAFANVGDAVEFPLGTLHSLGSQTVIPTSIDVSSTAITVTFPSAATAASGTFNGYLFTFSGAPRITNVTLNKSSTFTPVNFSFTSNSVQVNIAGKSIPAASKEIFDITTIPNLNGDYDGNGKVEAADYVVWRNTYADHASVMLNDPTFGTVDTSDHSYWRAHFGNSIGSGAVSISVPEPSRFVLAVPLVAFVWMRVSQRWLSISLRSLSTNSKRHGCK